MLILCKHCGLFLRCHFMNLSNGHALVNGNSFIKLVWTPSIKWEVAIASTTCTHLEGRYCNFNNIKNYCCDSLWQLTLIAECRAKHNNSKAYKVPVGIMFCVKSLVSFHVLGKGVKTWSTLDSGPFVFYGGCCRVRSPFMSSHVGPIVRVRPYC